VVFFAAVMWLAINHADVQAPDYPLVRIKYRLLLCLAPVVAVSGILQLNYFLGLRPDIITSCCGTLFSGGSASLADGITALPPVPAAVAFFVTAIAAAGSASYAALKSRGGYVVAGASLAAFAAAIAGIVSFLSLYIYEHPHHHCPFCILKSDFGYRGYWLYAPLFTATAAGLAAGAVQPFARTPSLRAAVPVMVGRLAVVAAVGFVVFASLGFWMVARSNLTLKSH
jgi:hypothetical protein